jgi:hypothetical protein
LTNIGDPKQGATTSTSAAKFKILNCSWWLSLVANIFSSINLLFENTKPDSIGLCSSRFATTSWLHSINGSTDSNGYVIRFYFPVLPIGQPYGRYDYFSIKLNDTMDIQFQSDADSVLTGSFISKRGVGKPTKLYAKNAISIQTTSANPMRIRSIQINGAYEKLVSSYLGFDLSKLKTGAAFYGLDFVDTVITEQLIQVNNVALSGTPALMADSTYRLTWSLVGASAVDRCSLSVSLDSGLTWTPAGKTLKADSSISWIAPHRESQHCFITVAAIGKNGLKYPGRSPQFSIKLPAPVNNQTPPVNNYMLRGAILSPSAVRLAWSSSTINDTAVTSIGIRFDSQHYPTSMKDSLSVSGGVFGLADTCDTIKSLQQNQEYFFSLFVANRAGVWSASTQNSIIRIRTSALPGQFVSLGIDTQRVFNDSLMLWSQPKLLMAFTDTLDNWNGPSLKAGFIQTGPGFSFRQGNIPPNTSVGIEAAYRTIPAPYKAADQRVYEYNIYTGNWRIDENPIVIDTVGHTVQTIINDARLPFMVMIDTMPPQIGQHLNSQSIFSVNQKIVDTFFVRDNIENVSLNLLAGPGNQNTGDLSLYVTPGQQPSSFLVTVPPNVADQCSGLRAFLVVSDGRNGDTINLSRTILREGTNCDDTLAKAMQWMPLLVTAQPENGRLSAVLSNSPGNTAPLAYDKKTMRIIQWLPLPENSASEEKWVEYEPSRDSLFKLTPGKLIWIKAQNDQAIHFGTAIVAALKDTFTVGLNNNGWTDFSIPYNFDLYMGDIFDATRKSSTPLVDSVEMYRWVKSGSLVRTEPVFLTGILGAANRTDTMRGGEAYSVYNPLSQNLFLRFPPTNVQSSSLNRGNPLQKRKDAPAPWSVRIGIISHDSDYCTPIYCASMPLSKIPRFYPMSPSLSSVTAGVVDAVHNLIYGHAANGDLSNGGAKFDIVCRNSSNEPCPVKIVLEKSLGLPPGIKAGLFAPGSSASSDTLRMVLAPMQKAGIVVIAGTDGYIKNFSRIYGTLLSFNAVSHYRGLKIIYSLPYSTKAVKFTCVDLKGRSVLTRVVSALSYSGYFEWSGGIAKGMYIIEMKATVEGSAQPQVLRKKVLYVR